MNTPNLSLIYQYALLLAAEEDWDRRELGPIHLLKFAYLADLEYAKHNQGSTFTEVDWTFHNFGPWSNEAHAEIEPAVLSIGAEKITRPSDYEDDFIRYLIKEHPEDLQRKEKALREKLPMEIRGTLQKAVHSFASDTKKLLHAVYATAPMLMAAPGEHLDFHTVVKEPQALYAPVEAAPPSVPLSRKKQSQLKSRMAELRKNCKQNFESARTTQTLQTEDLEEVVEVSDWLEQLAGPDFPKEGALVEFMDDIWKSESRRGGNYDDLPG